MKRSCIAIAVLLLAASAASAQPDWLGRWEGSLELVDGSVPFGVSIVEGGALLDLPSAELYGYPSMSASVSGDSISLAFEFGSGAVTLEGSASGGRVEGTYRQGSGDEAPGGRFSMARSATQPDARAAFSFAASDGAGLTGTLLVPAGTVRPPLVILHPGLGAADRDGNNYNVPGKNDALRQLAEALQARGVASYRYDKRGSGAASWLVTREDLQSLEAWIRDLASAAEALGGAGRFSGVWLLGLNDGALVAAAAANALAADGLPVAGLVAACAGAESALDAFSKAVARAPVEQRAAGEAIIAALLAGRAVGDLPDFYSSAFRPSIQPYLIEAFRRDLLTELARYAGKSLLVQGNMDMQVTLADFMKLRAARPDAETLMPLRMNHVLKDVSNDVEENLASFSEPGYPLSLEFVDGLVGFVNGRSAD